MKKLLTCALLALSSIAFGATTVPVQLLNPTGSTSGQAIVSTGSGTAPAWGNITATALASQAANTVVANVTASAASPTAFAMPSCSASGSSLQYTSGTGFACASNYALTTGATFTGAITPSQTNGIVGTTTNNNANAGAVGEYVCAQVTNGGSPSGCATNSSAPVSLTTSTATNVTSVSLAAGDWTCWGNVYFNPGATTSSQINAGWISTTSATLPTIPNGGAESSTTAAISGAQGTYGFTVGQGRFLLASTTTVFLGAFSAFSTSTNAAYGFLGCRRAR